jgi:hypothetical protein
MEIAIEQKLKVVPYFLKKYFFKKNPIYKELLPSGDLKKRLHQMMQPLLTDFSVLK